MSRRPWDATRCWLNPHSKRVKGAEISPTVGYPRLRAPCLCQFYSISERNKDEILKAWVFVSYDNALLRHALSRSATWFPPLHNWYRPFKAFRTNLPRFINCTLVYNSCFEQNQSAAILMFSLTTPWFSLSSGPGVMTVVLIICWKNPPSSRIDGDHHFKYFIKIAKCRTD